MRGIALICTTLIVSGATAAGCDRKTEFAASTEQSPPSTEEKAAYRPAVEPLLYKLAIEHWLKVGESPRELRRLVVAENTGLPDWFVSEQEEYKWLRDAKDKLSDELWQDLRTQSKKSVRLSRAKLPVSRPVVFLTEPEAKEIFSQGRDWEEFYGRYPGSQGMMSLSRIGINNDETQALVYLGNACGGLCGAGYLILLTKKHGQWSVEEMTLLWVS